MAEALSDDEIRQRYTTEVCTQNILVITIIVIVLILGIVGNFAAAMFYRRGARRSSTTFLLVVISINDLVTSMLNVSNTVYLCGKGSMRLGFACTMFGVVIKIGFQNSTLLLLVIAFARYFIQCSPFRIWYFTIKKVKKCLVMLFIFSCVLGSPYFVAITEVSLPIGEFENRTVHGYFCKQMPKPDMKEFVFVANLIDVTSGAIVLIMLFVLYVLILRHVRKRRQILEHSELELDEVSRRNGNGEPQNNDSSQIETDLDTHESTIEDGSNAMERISDNVENVQQTTGSNENKTNTTRGKKRPKKQRGNAEEKVTFTMFMMTLVSLLSLLPYIIPSIIPNTEKGFVADLIHRSYMLNTSLNPYVISFIDKRFRKYVKKIVLACFRCKLKVSML